MLAALIIAVAVILPAPQEALPRDLMGYTLGGAFDPDVQGVTGTVDANGRQVYEVVNSEGAVIKVGTDSSRKIVYLILEIENPTQDTIDHFLGQAMEKFGRFIRRRNISENFYEVVFNDGRTENRITGNRERITVLLTNAR